MAGTATSFEEFYDSSFAKLVALGAFLTQDQATGEDLAQEAMRTVTAKWDDVSGYESPLGFARRIVVHLASNERRRRSRETTATERLAPRTPVVHHDQPSSWIEFDPELWAAVSELPPNQRAAVALRYLDDLDTGEIAASLGCSPATVRVHLHRAHTALAQRLNMTTREEYPHD